MKSDKTGNLRRGSVNRRINLLGWRFVIPASLLILVLNFYPMFKAFYISLHKGIGSGSKFVGWSNYARILKDPLFKTAIGNTMTYLVIQVPIMLMLAMFLAYLLNSPNLKGKGVFRTLIFLPCATSLVSYAIIFRSMFSLDGFVNTVLLKLQIISQPINYLADPRTAKMVIIVALLWRWTGYNMIFFLAGLQNIDPAVYEAARIDGCNGWHLFWRVVFPLLRPIVVLTGVMSISGTLQLFDESVNLTNGGPANATITISHYIYKLSFINNPKFGYAAAISYIVFLMVAILSLIQVKIFDRREAA